MNYKNKKNMEIFLINCTKERKIKYIKAKLEQTKNKDVKMYGVLVSLVSLEELKINFSSEFLHLLILFLEDIFLLEQTFLYKNTSY